MIIDTDIIIYNTLEAIKDFIFGKDLFRGDRIVCTNVIVREIDLSTKIHSNNKFFTILVNKGKGDTSKIADYSK